MISKKEYLYFGIIHLLLFFFTLTYSYVEGDDASIVLYHVLGRNSKIQPVYSSYHGMFDYILSFISINEYYIRTIAILLSFISNTIFSILLIKLIRLYGISSKVILYFIPFILPELLFQGLYINPTLISINFVLLSHIYLKNNLINNDWFKYFLGIIFFGIGVSFRWNIGLYIFPLMSVYLIDAENHKFSLHNFKKTFFTGIALLLSVLFFIKISGYSYQNILEVYLQGKSYMDNKETSLMSYFANSMVFLTPAFIILLFLGVFICFKNKRYDLLLFLVLGIFPYTLLGFYPAFKYMIIAGIPMLLIITQSEVLLNITIKKILIVMLIMIPWFLGLKIYSNSAWGPGFELKNNNKLYSDVKNFNPDNTTKIEKIEMGFYSGLAMPTPEGPRPLYGWFWTLFNDWKKLINHIDYQRNCTVAQLINGGVIIQDVNHAWIATKLIEKGFIFKKNIVKYATEGYQIRMFEKNNIKIGIVIPINKELLFDIHFYEKFNDFNNIVIYSSYTNIISKLNTIKKINFIQKDAYFGIIYIK